MAVLFCTYPPPGNLAAFGLTLSCQMAPPPFVYPNTLTKVHMLGTAAYPDGHWKALIGSRTEPNKVAGAANLGFYTLGLDTCTGLGLSFLGPLQRHVALAHLSNAVADDPASITEIVHEMFRLGAAGQRVLQRAVIVVWGDPQTEPQADVLLRLAPLLQALGQEGVADEQITVCQSNTDPSARMAVDLALELGTW